MLENITKISTAIKGNITYVVMEKAPSLPPPDPNWLYSTMAQCSAAIIGIIGTFLIWQIMHIYTQKSSLLHKKSELENEVSNWNIENLIKSSFAH